MATQTKLALFTGESGGRSFADQLYAIHEKRRDITARKFDPLLFSGDTEELVNASSGLTDSQQAYRQGVDALLTFDVVMNTSSGSERLLERVKRAFGHFYEAWKLPANEAKSYAKLGLMYMYGVGTDKNIKEGVEMLHRAALAGHSVALFYYSFFAKGAHSLKGMSDEEYSTHCIKLAADAGYVPAILEKAFLHEKRGEISDAAVCYSKASIEGNDVATCRLGLLCLTGVQGPNGETIIAADHKKGRSFIKAALQKGNVIALRVKNLAAKKGIFSIGSIDLV